METRSIGNYQKADQLLRRNILDYSPWDRDALLALGDNSLAWGEYEPDRLEDARESFAKLIERFGRSDPLLERMLLYFIRTDNLGEVLPLKSYFMASAKRKISAAALAELGANQHQRRLGRQQPFQYILQGLGRNSGKSFNLGWGVSLRHTAESRKIRRGDAAPLIDQGIGYTQGQSGFSTGLGGYPGIGYRCGIVLQRPNVDH
jgi:hypothetical protein